jgi:hypothetical protein
MTIATRTSVRVTVVANIRPTLLLTDSEEQVLLSQCCLCALVQTTKFVAWTWN